MATRVSRQYVEVLALVISNLRVSRQHVEILKSIFILSSASSDLSLEQVADYLSVKERLASSNLSLEQVADYLLVREVSASSNLSLEQVADYLLVKEGLASSNLSLEQVADYLLVGEDAPNLRVSRQHVEVLALGIPNLRVSRQHVEILGSIFIAASASSNISFGQVANYLLVKEGLASSNISLGQVADYLLVKEGLAASILSLGQNADVSTVREILAASILSLGQSADISTIREVLASSILSLGQNADVSTVREILAASALSLGQSIDVSIVKEILAASALSLSHSVLYTIEIAPIDEGINTEIYGSVTEANTYFAKRLHERVWSNSSPNNRKKALWAATLIIDALNYKGNKHSESQFLEFPRDDGEVPQDIRITTYEIAHSLLDGKDPDIELEALGIKSYGFQGEATSYNREQVPIEHIINGVPSEQAWRLLRPYLREDDAIILSRIS